MNTQTALDALFGVPVTVAEPPPVPVEVVPLPQPVPVIIIAQPVPVRVPAAPCCLASRRPATGYPFQTGAERQRRFAEREQELRRLRDEETAWARCSMWAVIERDDSLEELGI
ncbi:MAG TPA: hypothetical protein VM537_32705 [Anaerolineae bacterium]|nr:hypothetical protein [Anaerolineae bacterium]